jgi:hypothetical protein
MSPALPASRRPLRITPTTHGSKALAAERNRGSMAVRSPCSFGPWRTCTRLPAKVEMPIRGWDGDASRLHSVAALGVGHRRGPGPGEVAGQIAGAGGREVLHDEHRRRQVGGESPMRSCSAWIPPAEAPITTMSRPGASDLWGVVYVLLVQAVPAASSSNRVVMAGVEGHCHMNRFRAKHSTA